MTTPTPLLALVALLAAAPVRTAPPGSVGTGGEARGATEIDPERAGESHRWMLNRLRALAAETPARNSYLGTRQAERARQRLAALGPDAHPAERWNALQNIGFHELRLGNVRESIAAYESALEDPGEVPADVLAGARIDLAVAYLRLGEVQNCIARHTSKSCILPIEGDGVHVDQEGSRTAIRILAEVLEGDPQDVRAQWLLNVAYMTVGGYPDEVPEQHRVDPAEFASGAEFPRFLDVAPERELNASTLCGGAIADDFNGDGHLDLVVASWDPRGQLRFHEGAGDGTFTDRTEEAGLAGISGGLNMMQADYDNDGLVDILVLRGAWLRGQGSHPNSLLKNVGGGRFVDATHAAGLAATEYPTQAAGWSDYDNDGDLDLYVANETLGKVRAPGQLWRNEGDGTFTDVARAAGVTNDLFAKGVTWGDYDGDRFPDLYVSNLNGPNRLYHNDGDGTFTDVAEALGVSAPMASFPTWFWDYDNDGALDLLVSSYHPDLRPSAASYLGREDDAERLRLYRGDGGKSFTDVAPTTGLTRMSPTMGCNFGDLDNDGYLDFYLGTGYPGYEGLVPNLMYWNRAGSHFADVTTAGGFGHVQKGHAVAFADLDEDGDQDVFIELGGAFPGDAFGDALFENPGFGNHALVVELVGKTSNRSAIGARIRCDIEEEESGERSIFRHVNTGGSFGANPLRQSIGTGRAEVVKRLEIYWPTSDTTQVFRDVPTGQHVVIAEGEETLELPR